MKGIRASTGRKLLRWFNSLPAFQNLILLGIFSWGVYAALGAEPPTAVSEAMSPLVYGVWMCIHLLAPPVSWMGQLIRNWWLQWAADSALCVMLATYVVANSATYEVFVFSVLAVCAFGLATRDVLEIACSEGVCRKKEMP